MQKLVLALAVAAALVHTTSARANDGFYAGLATGPSKLSVTNSTGERVGNSNRPIAFKGYAGFALNEHFAVEAGYKGTSKDYTFGKDTFGAGTTPQFEANAMYLAVKGTVAVGASVDLSAKLGAARNHYEMTGTGTQDRDVTSVKPMLGVGAAYKLSDKVALTLELEHYGTARGHQTKFTQRSVHAGVKYNF